MNICRTSKDAFDKNVNSLVPDLEKHDQSGKGNSTTNDLGTFEEICKEKVSDEELGSAISNQLAEMTIKHWSNSSK